MVAVHIADNAGIGIFSSGEGIYDKISAYEAGMGDGVGKSEFSIAVYNGFTGEVILEEVFEALG